MSNEIEPTETTDNAAPTPTPEQEEPKHEIIEAAPQPTAADVPQASAAEPMQVRIGRQPTATFTGGPVRRRDVDGNADDPPPEAAAPEE